MSILFALSVGGVVGAAFFWGRAIGRSEGQREIAALYGRPFKKLSALWPLVRQ